MAKLITLTQLKKSSRDYDGVTKNGKNFTKKLSYTDIENIWANYSNTTSVLRNILGLIGIKGIDFQYGKANTQKKGDLVAIMNKKENGKFKKLIIDTYFEITNNDFSTFLDKKYVQKKVAKSTAKKKSSQKKSFSDFSKSELIKTLGS